MKKISLLGSTGSIGTNVLNVVREFPDLFEIVALAAGRNVELVAQQSIEFTPQLISVLDEKHGDKLKKLLPSDLADRVVWGTEGNIAVANYRDAVFTVSSIVGAAGLLPTLAAIKGGKDVGLANKETLVMAGKLVMDNVRDAEVSLLPVDSEHSAIFQALEGGRREDVFKIILTASGGPFRLKSFEELQSVTPEQALAHPNWSMGRKISIDSATLMNKGLEVIEARWLFDIGMEDIEVVVHPQSIVHSLVEFQDGSVLAQMGIPDMRIPIAYALSYPERLPLNLHRLDLSKCGNLEFSTPDYQRFPALRLAFEALEKGGTQPAVLNSANEIAVDGFLNGIIAFPEISKIVKQTMDNITGGDENNLDDILDADSHAREYALRLVEKKS